MKLSQYNHFLPTADGQYIAYNAFSGTVGLMTAENYSTFLALSGKISDDSIEELNDEERALLKTLIFGKFVQTDGPDEKQLIKFRHNCRRFVKSGLGLVIAPTMACNMACRYCYEGNKSGRMSPEVMEAIQAVVEGQTSHLESLNVGWFGGEPLLAVDIIEKLSNSFIDLCDRSNITYGASMITNGVLLTPDVVDRLVDLKVEDAQVTIDGPARIHNIRRPLKNGKRSFETIIRNIIYAVSRMHIGLRVNVDKQCTGDTIRELLDELGQAGLSKNIVIRFGNVEPFTEACANISETCYGTLDFSKTEVELYRILFENGYKIGKIPRPIDVFCMAQYINAFLIDPLGEIYRCNHHIGNQEKSMGNIRKGIDYEHPNFHRMFAFNPFDDAICCDCNLLPLCMGGCPSQRIDRDLSSEELCRSWKYNLQPMLELVTLARQQELLEQAQVDKKSATVVAEDNDRG